jgi:homoserine O-succinyltransferase
MVINFDSCRFSRDSQPAGVRPIRRVVSAKPPAHAGECITIGLVNNMAGAAFKATERQFLSLLDAASDGVPIHVSFYALPGMTPAEAGGTHFASHYAGLDKLLDTHLDGLIVTGREPRMADLRDEPYWESFTQVLEWARTNTYSAVWSCLAAHAAVLHMDGVGRRKSAEKKFGVFDCARASDHPMAQGLGSQFKVPHSRWNGVLDRDLEARGYHILSRIQGDGVDTFIKQEGSLFVFFQGHLEYDSDTLMREYRRDVGRYIKGETATYPPLPHGYFDRATEQALTVLGNKAAAFRTSELLTDLVAVLERSKVEQSWQRSAALIYRNWLEIIAARKNESLASRRAVGGLSILR